MIVRRKRRSKKLFDSVCIGLYDKIEIKTRNNFTTPTSSFLTFEDILTEYLCNGTDFNTKGFNSSEIVDICVENGSIVITTKEYIHKIDKTRQ